MISCRLHMKHKYTMKCQCILEKLTQSGHSWVSDTYTGTSKVNSGSRRRCGREFQAEGEPLWKALKGLADSDSWKDILMVGGGWTSGDGYKMRQERLAEVRFW